MKKDVAHLAGAARDKAISSISLFAASVKRYLPQKIKDIYAEVVGRMGMELFRVKNACAKIHFE